MAELHRLSSELPVRAPFIAIAADVGRSARGRWVGFRRADYFEVRTITRGQGWQRLSTTGRRGEPEPVLPGQLLFLGPKDIHDFEAGEGGVSLVTVLFPVPAWLRFAGVAGIRSSWYTSHHVPSAQFEPADESILAPFLRAIERFGAGPTPLDLVQFWATVIPPLLARTDASPEETGAPGWLDDALTAMHDEENLRRGLARFRELAHVSAPHLARMTRRHLGTSPLEIVAQLQLQHAASLLLTTTESVAGIGHRCGFDSGTYFSTRFHAAYGMPPSEYRRAGLAAAS